LPFANLAPRFRLRVIAKVIAKVMTKRLREGILMEDGSFAGFLAAARRAGLMGAFTPRAVGEAAPLP